MMNKNKEVDLSPAVLNSVSVVREQYYYLLSHIDALVQFFIEEAQLKADVFVLPNPNVNDVGSAMASFSVQQVKGQEAVSRALDHFADHKLKFLQAGVMANRLPGVLHVSGISQSEVVARITKVNAEKDKLMGLIRSCSSSMTEQFLLTKAAIPYAIRKSIGRHIHVYEQGQLKSVSFSVSKRSSTSKVQPRQQWLEKLERSRKYVMSLQDSDVSSWNDQIDIEEKALNQLPESAMLRIVRPLRKSPIINLVYEDGKKASQIAHSPIVVLNDVHVKVNPMKSYHVEAVASINNKEAVVPRWHLYRFKE